MSPSSPMSAVLCGVVLVCMCFAGAALAHPHHARVVAAAASSGNDNDVKLRLAHPDPVSGHYLCGTTEAWNYRVANNLTAPKADCMEAKCDDPTVRDATEKRVRHMRIGFTVFNEIMTKAEIEATYKEYEATFLRHRIQTHLAFITMADDTVVTKGSRCLSVYSPFSDDWYTELIELKQKHSQSPENVLNVFVGCQNEGPQGTLLGIATFPWDSSSLTNSGGLWMNHVAMGVEDATLPHEAGHCLGLWHPFHGVDEIRVCAPDYPVCGLDCCERVHELSDLTSDPNNLVGDMCSDTMAQPMDYYCANPAGKECSGASWDRDGDVDYKNFMGYAMRDPRTGATDHCQDRFSEQQTNRMACYLDNELVGWQCDPSTTC